ncbi:unnamed protein product [Gongylonema pulchrum]|uniref:Uncharacterized protein n=1 Tax=Gongylonema pulchrum TaxID=637853 RepID=A0A3P6Q5M2_9BILA|nr:unnamed protein product [Gongylonema pulchrum]
MHITYGIHQLYNLDDRVRGMNMGDWMYYHREPLYCMKDKRWYNRDAYYPTEIVRVDQIYCL